MNKTDSCPCKSGKTYGECCEPILSGERKASTAVELMRARYSAYAVGNVKFLYAAANQSVLVPVTQTRTLYISESDITLTEDGQTQALTLTNSKAAAVKWSSSNTAVATVSSSGTVTAVANGKAVITVMSTANSKYTDNVNVIVNIPPPPSPPENSAGDSDDNSNVDSNDGSNDSSGSNSPSRTRRRIRR